MNSNDDTKDAIVKLLSNLELDKVISSVAEIIESRAGCDAIGIAVWDADLEEYADRGCFGEGKKKMSAFLEEYLEQREVHVSDELSEVDLDDFESNHLERVLVQPILHDDDLCA